MNKKQSKNRIKQAILTGFVAIFLGASFAATAWATVSLVKPNDAVEMHEAASLVEIPEVYLEENKSRAPEPTTLALFGSGLLGMIGSFIRRTYEATKRILDVLAVIFGVIILSPLLILTALAVKLTSKGPMIYKQTRVGRYGRYFTIYKFRTMCENAEKGTGAVWAKTNDTRLTPIGRFLRLTHIDELPQLFNILRGEMSLIGPRPERPKFVKDFKKTIPEYERRLLAKPGITGLAQVWWRYDESVTDVKKKLKYDILYVKRVCLWADFQILLRTFRVVLTGEGAK